MNEDQTLKSLQLEFEDILTCIKPIYLSWKNQQDKVYIAGWIKKLTNLKCLTLDYMHLRNLYILALYENLRRDILCDPFTKNPPADELPPLSNHLKQLIERFSAKGTAPEWLDTDEKGVDVGSNGPMENGTDYEEDDYIGDLKLSSDRTDVRQMNPADRPNDGETNGLSFGDVYKYHGFNNEWLRQSAMGHIYHDKDCKSQKPMTPLVQSMDTDNETGKHHGVEDGRLKQHPSDTSLFTKIQEKEMERRLAQLQNAYHEDILKLRNQNDSEIQNIINRKNIEIDQIRTNYKDKIQEQEVQMQLLETKANDCMKQLQVFQETKMKEIEQMKRNHAEILENYKRESDQRIENLVDDFQKEKYKLLEEHKRHEELFSKESKEYFDKVKVGFTEKSVATNRQISALETDIMELKNSKDKIFEQNEKLKLENGNLTIEIRKLQNDLADYQKRYQFIDNQHSRLVLTHESDIKSLKDTLETALHRAECIKDEVEVKAHDKIEELEAKIKDLQTNHQDTIRCHKSELENINMNYNSEKFHMKQAYEEEIENMKFQLKTIKFQYESQIGDLANKLDTKESQLNQINKDLESKEKIAVQLVEDLRLEMNHNADRLLRKKQIEFEKIESELKAEIQEKNKEVVDLMHQLSSHKQETEIKLSEIRKWSDNQISSLTNDWKQEKNSLDRDFQFQLTKMSEDNQKTLEKLIEEKNKKICEMQNMFDTMTREIPILKRELYQQVQNHKNEINDLIHMYENEKIKLIEDHKTVVESLNQQASELKCRLEEKNAENVSKILSKTNEKLKEIENEYSERSLQSFKIINDLKATTEKLKEEKAELLNSQEDFKINLTKKYNSELENLQKVIKINLETYKKEMNNDQIKYKNLEKQLDRKDHEAKKQLNLVKYEYEGKLSKLMPLEVQNDYEETILSLRSQISFLQQKIELLEDEVNSMNIMKTYHSNGFSKQKYEQLFES